MLSTDGVPVAIDFEEFRTLSMWHYHKSSLNFENKKNQYIQNYFYQ